ncbi:FAD-dependent oxidoreductase [Egicoccus halophilus]|uniref:FAD/NAD(P)-binding domain-containing protein n=1 Tax=Egicoccus halophilus TaxID=1670830 RepID=A0A8J3EUZ6_9ACTN|nr:FAD-dependent oxidoreductase [Egicoccus halophilus]GGI07023.1 hypothetical protein GCM10011354_22020 [Egicoccus halophilus]
MATVVIVGDGPGGLGAALFLARAEHDTRVYGTDKTAMHHAHLHNYLGIEELGGSEFQQIARRQVTAAGASLDETEVESVERRDDRFVITLDGGTTVEANYLVLAGGKSAQSLAAQAGATVEDGRVSVDVEYRTDVDRLYAVGRLVRPERSQAIISAGAGATVALDILSREAGKDVHDWDSPPEQ